MTTATSIDSLESRLDVLFKAAIEIKKSFPSLPISIEIPGSTAGKPYITFIQTSWTVGDAKWITSICEEFDLTYSISPMDNRLVVTLYVS